ncbi:MAG: hypothetical protein HUJ68_04800 [Clostridia bacterium]|nr:hypothetical protein [Clostridia bacterium]
MKINDKISIDTLYDKESDIICVIGCLKTNKGMQILDSLKSWTKMFKTYIVYQELPGDMFEYPALKFAKDISKIYNKPVLYLHTKGAVNDNIYADAVRQIWKSVFIDKYDECVKKLNENYDIVCPFTADKNHITWYNGFIASTNAWDKINIEPSSNRFIYEMLFNGVDVKSFGILNNDIADCDTMHNFFVQKIMPNLK